MKRILLLALCVFSISYSVAVNTIKQIGEPFNAYGGLKLDSIMYQSETNIRDRSKTAYEYNDDGRVTMKASYKKYDYINALWIGSYKDEYTYLPGGSSIYHNYNWSEESFDWGMSSQTNDNYDSNGHNISTIYFTWNASSSSLVFSSKKEYEYYDGTNLLYTMIESKWSNNSWVNKQKNIYEYDDNGNMVSGITQKWSNSWVNYAKVVQAYNSSNLITSKEVFLWNTTSKKWVEQMKYNYTYTTSGNLNTETQWLWDSNQNSYIGYQKDRCTYNSNGFLVKKERQEYNGYVLWTTTMTETYERDDRGNMLSYTMDLVSEGPIMHYEYTYDANNNWVTNSDFEWDETSSSWALSSIDSVMYDEFNNVTEIKSYDNNYNLKGTKTYFYSTSDFSPLKIDFDYLYTWNSKFPDYWYTGDSIGVITTINNNTSEPFAGMFALQLVNESDETITQIMSTIDMSENIIAPLNYKVIRFNGKLTVPAGTYIQTILYRNNMQEDWQIVGCTEGHENPTTFIVSAREESERYVILAQRNTSSNWFYMTSDLGTASTKRYQAVDAGTNILANVSSTGLADKYYWEIEGNKLKTAAGYSTWTSGNSANLNATGKELAIQQQADGTFTFSFADGDNTRYLALNKTAGNDYFAYYNGTNQIYKLTLVKEGNSGIVTSAEKAVMPTTQARKIFRNGQLFILRDGKTYTVQGQEVR